jgi:hypothetical protein
MRSSSRLIGLIATARRADALVGADLSERRRSAEQTQAGRLDAGVAAKGMRPDVVLEKAAQFDTVRGLTFINSDMAFGNGHYAYQGNFAGFTIGT